MLLLLLLLLLLGVGGALRAVLGLGDGDRAEVVADSVARCEAIIM